MRFRRRRGHKAPLFLIFSGVVLLLAGVLLFSEQQVLPVVRQLAEMELQNQVTIQLDELCSHSDTLKDLDYSKLVTLNYDPSGKLTALTTDMGTMNRLRSSLITEVEHYIHSGERKWIHVPLGAVLKLTFLPSLGPELAVEVLPIGCSSADLKSAFSSAGINQTRHQIYLTATVDALLLIPGRTYTNTVEASTIIAETVLLGDVPQSYASLNGGISASDALAEE